MVTLVRRLDVDALDDADCALARVKTEAAVIATYEIDERIVYNLQAVVRLLPERCTSGYLSPYIENLQTLRCRLKTTLCRKTVYFRRYHVACARLAEPFMGSPQSSSSSHIVVLRIRSCGESQVRKPGQVPLGQSSACKESCVSH